MRQHFLPFAAALALAACQKGGEAKKGPFVAEGTGVSITAEEFKARLDEQSPFIRSRYTTLERKKEFLENLLRQEVLAQEAARLGLDKDADVQLTLKRVMVQKLVQKTFGDPQEATKSIPDADAKAYFDQHRDEFSRPQRLRVYQIVLKAPAGPERQQRVGATKKLVEEVRKAEKTNQLAFANIAREKNEDDATKNSGGDLGFKSREELEKAAGKAVADAAFALKDNEIGGPVESALGLHVLKVTGRQEALDRPFDQVKAQIQNRLYRERKTKEFEEFVKGLKEKAQVKVIDAELEKVAVAAPPPGGPAMPGTAPGAMLAPQPPPAAAPAPAKKP